MGSGQPTWSISTRWSAGIIRRCSWIELPADLPSAAILVEGVRFGLRHHQERGHGTSSRRSIAAAGRYSSMQDGLSSRARHAEVSIDQARAGRGRLWVAASSTSESAAPASPVSRGPTRSTRRSIPASMFDRSLSNKDLDSVCRRAYQEEGIVRCMDDAIEPQIASAGECGDRALAPLGPHGRLWVGDHEENEELVHRSGDGRYGPPCRSPVMLRTPDKIKTGRHKSRALDVETPPPPDDEAITR